MHLHPQRRGTGAPILLSVLVAAMLAACSSAATAAPGGDGYAGAGAAATAAPAMPEGAPASAASGEAQGLAGRAGSTTDPATNQALADRLIVRTATLSLEVAGIDDALARAQQIVTAAGGYVASGQRSGDADRATATITYRVPVDHFEAILSSVRGIGSKLLSEQIGSEEVTAQVVDLAARLTNLRASEAALQKIMDQATRIPDILAVQEQLSTTRDEIERLVAQKQNLEQQAGMSTLTVTYALPPAVAVETVSAGWNPAGVVDRAIATMVGIGQGIAEMAIWFGIVILPLLVVVGIPTLLVLLVARRRRRRRAAGGQGPTPEPPVTPAAASAAS